MRNKLCVVCLSTLIVAVLLSCQSVPSSEDRPNIILVMSDDQGWGQVGYFNHPILKTPNLVEMAKNGLRLDRFYAGAPVCSPTRASVLTGRANDRTAVFAHGEPMRIQEKTIAQALKGIGYTTAHFGKWHLDGLKGPGVPILNEDIRNPGYFGFDEWISVTNFFDIDPLMSHKGEIKEYTGSSSDIIVRQALEFISKNKNDPFFVVIWYGSPHDPWSALARDKSEIPQQLEEKDRNYLGEIVEMDRSIGVLRNELKNKGLAQNTILWFNSDNGGLPQGGKEGVGGLRGFKGSVYEGGLRVPCIIEWPAQIDGGQISNYPASTMDIFPTIHSIVGLAANQMVQPIDGISIQPIFNSTTTIRQKPIPFKYRNKGALIDNDFKLVVEDIEKKHYALYDLKVDTDENKDVLSTHTEKGMEMIEYYEHWLESVKNSIAGNDYEGGLSVPDPDSEFWWDSPAYKPYIEKWRDRPEYHDRLKRANKIEDR
ncbi:sulfatase-like hydrolase/transferase [Cyclobacterium xiamenense]|uniref:sulfatase-like hydrolase/transferase n=1 Tax=Cyclobacterium xiamenense TaxID=1297121 RepID=UPI0012B9FEEC|nr:sulfatase-like hydrolase/transferase [Cyclobacterium xiamenense]